MVVIFVGIILMVGAKWLGGWFALLGVLIILGAILANSIVQVEGGTAGAQKLFGAPLKRVLKPGWRWIIPFFTEIKFVTTKHLPHEGAALEVETNDGFALGINYTIYYGFIPELVWHFVDDIEEPFDENYLNKWLREIFQNKVRAHSSKEIQEQSALSLALQNDIRAQFYSELDDRMLRVCGQTIINNVQVVFGNYIYAPKFLAQQEALRDANNNALIAQQKAKADIEEAKGISKATVEIAKGDAAAIEAKGTAENKVLEEKGRILTEKPAISENEAAKHVPQTVVTGGGITPVMDIMRSLYPHDDSSAATPASTTPAPTPAPTTPTPPAP